MLRGNGGVISYLGTTDMREVEKCILNGDKEAELIFDAMVYQVSNWLGYLSPIVKGEIDFIILTGGLANSDRFTKALKARVGFLAEVIVIPGENELESLAYGVLRVIQGKEEYNIYTKRGMEGGE